MGEYLRANPVAASLIMLSGSSALGQGLVLLLAPLLTRIYSPDDYGAFSYVMAFTGILSMLAGFRYELGAPLARSDETAGVLLRLALVTATVVSCLIALGVGLWGLALDDGSDLQLMPWLWMLPAMIWVTVLYDVVSQAAIRRRQYSEVAKRSFVQAVTGGLAQLTLGLTLRSPGGLILGQLLGRCMGIASLARASSDLLVSRHPFRGARSVAREYWRLPAVFTPSALLNVLGSQLPLLAIGLWFGVEAAGFVGVTQRILDAPAALIGTAIAQVFFGEISARHREGLTNNRAAYVLATKKLLPIGVALTLGILVLAPIVFPLFLGQQWADSGAYAQAMAFSVGVGFIASPLSRVYFIYQRVGATILVDIFRVAAVGVLGLLGYHLGLGPVGTLWLMYGGQFVTYVIIWFSGLRMVSEERDVAGLNSSGCSGQQGVESGRPSPPGEELVPLTAEPRSDRALSADSDPAPQ